MQSTAQLKCPLTLTLHRGLEDDDDFEEWQSILPRTSCVLDVALGLVLSLQTATWEWRVFADNLIGTGSSC